MVDFNRSRRTWHAHIVRWGKGPNNGALIRGTTRRVVTLAMVEYTPRERGLFQDGAVRFWMSALNVAEANIPDHEQDILEFRKRRYKILLPPVGQQPDGSWIAFDLSCMFTERV